jgi:uncharacterized protein (DUF58 family)
MSGARSSIVDSTFGFDGAFLQRLERLAVLNRRPLQGASAGPRRSPRHGASVEFADFRDYVPGDDFRRIDWNAYARLDRLFLRLYRAEEITIVTILLDHSISMHFGDPSKSLTAGRLAAILSYVALHGYDTVAIGGWGDRIDHYLPGQSGKIAIPRVWRTIARLVETPIAATDFASLRKFGNYQRGPGIAVVLSDFMTDSDWRAGLRSLRAAGQEVTAIQILTPEEVDPALRGDWKLVDAETGRAAEVTISPRLLRRYREALDRHITAISDFCHREGIAFVQLSSDVDLAGTVLSELRMAGILG